ncbi:hypothetical protein PC112_g24560, partial [Phytophthora cactorum]
MRIKTRDAP